MKRWMLPDSANRCDLFFGHLDREKRVEHACVLLSYSNLSVSQIAYESGYGNVPYFIKQFESITRQTPKEYRISLLQGSENRIKSSTFDAR